MVCLLTEHHNVSFCGRLVAVTESEATEKFYTASRLYYLTFHRNITLQGFG
jgi:hypothetical protein